MDVQLLAAHTLASGADLFPLHSMPDLAKLYAGKCCAGLPSCALPYLALLCLVFPCVNQVTGIEQPIFLISGTSHLRLPYRCRISFPPPALQQTHQQLDPPDIALQIFPLGLPPGPSRLHIPNE